MCRCRWRCRAGHCRLSRTWAGWRSDTRWSWTWRNAIIENFASKLIHLYTDLPVCRLRGIQHIIRDLHSGDQILEVSVIMDVTEHIADNIGEEDACNSEEEDGLGHHLWLLDCWCCCCRGRVRKIGVKDIIPLQFYMFLQVLVFKESGKNQFSKIFIFKATKDTWHFDKRSRSRSEQNAVSDYWHPILLLFLEFWHD